MEDMRLEVIEAGTLAELANEFDAFKKTSGKGKTFYDMDYKSEDTLQGRRFTLIIAYLQ
jgi:hypothetical protein